MGGGVWGGHGRGTVLEDGKGSLAITVYRGFYYPIIWGL